MCFAYYFLSCFCSSKFFYLKFVIECPTFECVLLDYCGGISVKYNFFKPMHDLLD